MLKEVRFVTMLSAAQSDFIVSLDKSFSDSMLNDSERLGRESNMNKQIDSMLQGKFEIEFYSAIYVFRRPYSEYDNAVAYSRGFKVLEIAKFTSKDSRTVVGLVRQIIVPYGKAGNGDILKLELFPSYFVRH